MTPVVELRRSDELLWLILNRPERRNAIDDELLRALDESMTLAEADDGVRAVVIAGRGASFCAGADLRHLLEIADHPDEPTRFLSAISAFATRLERSPKAIVAAVHGHVVAGGLEIALACDVVVAAEGTLVGDGHLRHRLLPAAGSSVRLPRHVGQALARHLLLSGQLLPAERFVRVGWIASVVAPEVLDDEAEAVARELADVAGPAQRNLKRLLHELQDLGATEGLELELESFSANWTEAQVPEALEAFLSVRTRAGG